MTRTDLTLSTVERQILLGLARAAIGERLFADGRLERTDIGQAHHDMEEGKVVFGNRVALVGASETGMGRS